MLKPYFIMESTYYFCLISLRISFVSNTVRHIPNYMLFGRLSSSAFCYFSPKIFTHYGIQEIFFRPVQPWATAKCSPPTTSATYPSTYSTMRKNLGQKWLMLQLMPENMKYAKIKWLNILIKNGWNYSLKVAVSQGSLRKITPKLT